MKKQSIIIKHFFLFFFLLGLQTGPASNNSRLPEPAGYPGQSLLNINNISVWIYNDGRVGISPNGSDPGTIFPRQTSNVVYLDGIVWGGQVKDGQSPELRVGGSTYRSGLQPGAILGVRTGNTENPLSDDVRVWRVRRDWSTADLGLDAAEIMMVDPENVTQNMIDEVKNQYENDWNEWPWQKGAPYQDINGNGQYESGIDIPGIPGADQTAWFVANDLDESRAISLAGSQPIGIEMQNTFWGYERKTGDPFADMIFRAVRVIYKGKSETPESAEIENMYLTLWSDPDIGKYRNDFAGCDSVLNLAYAYNGEPNDDNFSVLGLMPPAYGYHLLHGPVIESPGDTAIFNFSARAGFKNIECSSFLYFASGSSDSDPRLGEYQGTLEWYNLMQGLRPQAGTPWINPHSGLPTKFPLSGDPLTGVGWTDGTPYPPADRRMGLTTGPFTLALGDTQEIYSACIGDLSLTGTLASLHHIDAVKRKAKDIKDFFRSEIALDLMGPKLAELKSEVSLSASALLFNPSESVQSINWTMNSKPQNSETTLESTQGELVSFSPDLPGSYTVRAVLSTTGGHTKQAEFTLLASDNAPPVIKVIKNKQELVWSDSVLINVGQSTDPESDPINFSFDYPDWIRLAENDYQVLLTPRTTGMQKVTVIADDGYFGSVLQDSFLVHPQISPNLSLVDSYIDSTMLPGFQWHLKGDTLLTASMYGKSDYIQIYRIFPDSISHQTRIFLPNTVRIYRIKNDLLYTGEKGSSPFAGPGPLSIYRLTGGWNLSPVLEDYSPGDNDIAGVIFDGDIAFMTCFQDGYLYKVDFGTDPGSPVILQQKLFEYPINLGGITDVDDSFIIARVSQYGNRINHILAKTNLSESGVLEIPGMWRTFSIKDGGLFVTYDDSVVIYNCQNILNPVRVSSISVSAPVLWDDTAIRFHTGAKRLSAGILSIKTKYGIALYTIDDPANPQASGVWYDGLDADIYNYAGNAFLLVNPVTGLDISNPYSAFNLISVTTNVEDLSPQHPIAFFLEQNYPNPFNPATKIGFYTPLAQRILLEIYDVLGRKICTLIDKPVNAGFHEVLFEGGSLASGLYFYRLKAGEQQHIRKMILIR